MKKIIMEEMGKVLRKEFGLMVVDSVTEQESFWGSRSAYGAENELMRDSL